MDRIHVVEVLEATAGGTRRHLRDLVRQLDHRRFRVTVVAALARDPDFQRDIDLYRMKGVAVEILTMKRRIAPLADGVALIRLTRLLRRLHPDIVHAHSSKAGMLARLAAQCAGGVPTVFTPHAFAFLADTSLRGLYLACERWAARRTSRVIAVSREEFDRACAGRHGLGMPAAHVRLIPNGIEKTALPPLTRQPPPLVGFVGRMCRQKGPDLFVAVARILHAARPDVRFMMVGDGPWRTWVEEHLRRWNLSDCVTLRTARDEIEVGKYIAEMDALVMPSRWEGLPYTLLEAMSLGVPVAAMAVGGIADVIEDGISGVLCQPGDVHGLALRALALITDHPLTERLRTHAHQRLGCYTMQGMVTATAALYSELAALKTGSHNNSAGRDPARG